MSFFSGLFSKNTNANINNDNVYEDLGCDWNCDRCGAFMNNQPKFTTISGTWICKDCGFENDVTEDNIVYDDDEFDGIGNESIDVDDAALIWASNGGDEDYAFGYSEEELRDALK